MTLDVASIRAKFPLLQRQINGQRLVYLDSANTSQKPRSVIDAMTHFMETSYAPINRSAYQLAADATEAIEHVPAPAVGAGDDFTGRLAVVDPDLAHPPSLGVVMQIAVESRPRQ